MPFLAPILPVPQGATHGNVGSASHRTPRRLGSKAKLTPRGSTLKAPSHTPRGSIQGRGSREGDGLLTTRPLDASTPGGKGHGGSSASPPGPPADAFRLTVPEVELATKAWLQILDTSGGQPQDGSGSGGSPSAKNTLAASQQATAFARACTEVAYLHDGRELRDMLRLLHIPVLSVIGDLIHNVVELSNVVPGNGAVSKPSMHFFRFLRFLCECKHLAAILRYHTTLQQKRNTTSVLSQYNSSPHPMAALESSGMEDEQEEPREELEMDDIRATYDYLKEEAAMAQHSDGSDAASPRQHSRTGEGSTHNATTVAAAVTAETVKAFAQRFDLSLLAVLPQEYLNMHTTPETRSVSTPPPATTLQIDPLFAAGHDPFASSPRTVGIASHGSPRHLASSPPPPKPQPSLQPAMASTEITLEMFAEQVRGDDDADDVSLLGGGGDALFGIRREESCGSPAVSRAASQKMTILSPLRLGAISAPLLSELKSDSGQGPGRGTTNAPTGNVAGAATLNAERNYSTLLTLQPFATWAESHSRLSTLQLPPLVYRRFEEHKEKKREADRARREREVRLRDEYLYGPPRPKPKKKSVDEESVMLLREATELAEALPDKDIFDVNRMMSKIHNVQCERRRAKEREDNRYAFLLGGDSSGNKHISAASNVKPSPTVVMGKGVRQATAQEILAMLHRCPQDSVLGTQSMVRREQQLRGMNGLDTRRAGTLSVTKHQSPHRKSPQPKSGDVTPTVQTHHA
jgi:hypothetical protein